MCFGYLVGIPNVPKFSFKTVLITFCLFCFHVSLGVLFDKGGRLDYHTFLSDDCYTFYVKNA